LTRSTPGPAGSFSYDSAADAWSWADGVFEIHGFAPGEVVPSTELWLVHRHPDDRVGARQMLRAEGTSGRAFAAWHRVVDAKGRLRQVLTVGDVERQWGEEHCLNGFMVDVTAQLRAMTTAEVERAVGAVNESRPVIEQAKGALMFRFALDAETAFEVIRRRSQRTNVKVRDVARSVLAAMADGGFDAKDEQAWSDLVRELTADRS